MNLEPKYAASDDPADRAATERADAYMNRQYLDPVLLGRYPERAARKSSARRGPQWPAEDLKSISQPIDFVGINYYTRNVTRFDAARWPCMPAPVRQKQATYTETGWEVFPQGLIDTLSRSRIATATRAFT